MLELRNICWSTPDGRRVLDDVSLVLPDRGLVVITGPNGGGKTTLAKIIAGIEKPESGRLLLSGEDITDLDVTERARRGISYAFQQPVRFKGITVCDLLEIASGGRLSEKDLRQTRMEYARCRLAVQQTSVQIPVLLGEKKLSFAGLCDVVLRKPCGPVDAVSLPVREEPHDGSGRREVTRGE